jgi:DedD protein
MGLFSSFQRKREPRRQQRAAVPQDAASAELLRVRARRRLIGAAVLVVLAVIALPQVFESQPRPLDTSIAIVLPRKDSVVPVQAPVPPVPVQAPLPESPDAVPQTPPHAPPSVAATPAMAPPAPVTPPIAVPAPQPAVDNAVAEKAARDKAARDKAERADRLAADRAAAEKMVADRAAAAERAAALTKAAAEKALAAKKAESSVRFVVQVGAFAEPAMVREARQRIEKLGLRATEQEVETSSGRRTRVRLGPFNTREEAERALTRLRAAGLPGAVLTL